MRKICLLVGATLGLWATAFALPVAADAPGPTDYRSLVSDVEPSTSTIEATVLGGDSFLQLKVAKGTSVEIGGYESGAYLRFKPNGQVEENQNNVTTYLNRSRDAQIDLPNLPKTPRWKVVSNNGIYAWHDHRIHWMSKDPLPLQSAPTWKVPIVVDGKSVSIEGSFRRVEAPTPLPWIALTLLSAAVVVALGRKVFEPLNSAGLAVLVSGGLAVAAAVAQRSASPLSQPPSPVIMVLPAIAVVAGIIAVMQRGKVLRGISVLAATAALAGWALMRLDHLTKALVPTTLPTAVDRLSVSTALAAAVAAGFLAVRSDAFIPDALTRNDTSVTE